jgi:hypothetical protein
MNFFLLLVSFLLPFFTLSLPACSVSPSEVSSLSAKFVSLASVVGYDVRAAGNLRYVNNLKAFSWLANLFGANPDSPYFVYLMKEVGGLVSFPWWHQMPQDVLVFLGCTPSQMTYFAWTSYIVGKNIFDTEFASMADSINHLNVRFKGHASFPFNQFVSHVVSGDSKSYSDITRALESAGVSKKRACFLF